MEDIFTACILNYNFPEITDNLVENIKEKNKNFKYNLVVFDNGSDEDKISKYTTHRVEINERMIGGFNYCLQIAKEMKSDFVCLMTNDIYFMTDEPFNSLYQKLKNDDTIGVIHPAITNETVTMMDFMKIKTKPENSDIKFHYFVDIMAPVYRKEALDLINWKFDTIFEYGWGIDIDSCHIFRQGGYKCAVDFNCVIHHMLAQTYLNKRDKEFKNYDTFKTVALENMFNAFTKKYGPNWKEIVKHYF